jgi:hypothetical protein
LPGSHFHSEIAVEKCELRDTLRHITNIERVLFSLGILQDAEDEHLREEALAAILPVTAPEFVT